METRHQARDEVNALLGSADKELQNKLYHYVFVPSETYITVTVGVKRAIDKIAYLDTGVLLGELILLLSEVQKTVSGLQANLKAAEFANFQDSAGKISDKLSTYNKESTIRDLQSVLLEKNKLSTHWSALIYNLQKIIDNPKRLKLDEKQLAFFKELKVWLDGFYLHFCMRSRREELQQMIVSPEAEMQKEVDHPVVERKLKITAGMQRALIKMGDMDGKESLPMILSLLHDIRKKVVNDPELAKTTEAIEYSLKILGEANETLCKGRLEQLDILKGLTDKIEPDLKELVEKIKQAQITEAIAQECKELAFFLEALYFHSYKDRNKFFDPEDTTIKQVTSNKLSKMMIADFYHQAALAMEDLLQTLQKQKEVKHDEAEFKQDGELSPQMEKPAQTLELHKAEQVSERSIGSDVKVRQNTTKADEIKSEKPNPTFDEEAFWTILDKASGSADEIKIESLLNAMSKYKLSENQKTHLHHLETKVPEFFNQYKNNRYLWQKAISSIPLIGGYLDPYLQRYNADIANQALNNSSSGDPETFLQRLAMARYLLASPERSSNELLKKTNELLLNAYVHLHNIGPGKRLAKEEVPPGLLLTYGKFSPSTTHRVKVIPLDELASDNQELMRRKMTQ
ncbi:hypothetical protein [Aquicella lusitana]|uniref:Uncharacterized protein n=1 Tax=Aquicella lusitana TaxID=254246 RepID=A0A370GWQ7_9COXI|nr:hypothetical protein [Aquicella lusitana]RDI48118.1 hypothetical protein C8D86_10383 [Aquicella lusitana]VVC72866.1 hypothetical protein AQULUS_05900 [Aquicella lusitana]